MERKRMGDLALTDRRSIARVKPVFGRSHWCEGTNVDGTVCAQVVLNTHNRCEAGHPNKALGKELAGALRRTLTESDNSPDAEASAYEVEALTQNPALGGPRSISLVAFRNVSPIKNLPKDDLNCWGICSQNSMAITQASAELLGIPEFNTSIFEPDGRDYRIAETMLGEVARGPKSTAPLWSGHEFTPERLAQFIPGRTVRLPLTAVTIDKNEARQYTLSYRQTIGTERTILVFDPGVRHFDYGKIGFETDEYIVAGDFLVVSMAQVEDLHWDTFLTEIHLRSILVIPGSSPDFNQCKESSRAYARYLRSRGQDARWLQLSGSPDYPNADSVWRSIPPEVRYHYVTKVDGKYHDFAHRQFDPASPEHFITKDHGWDREYDITIELG
jgi:hypothetical protein